MSEVELKEAIRQFDVQKYLTQHQIVSVTDREWVLVCPLCGKSKLTVNLEKKAFHCWVCESASFSGRGGLIALIELLDGCTRFEAARMVLRAANPHVPVNFIDSQLAEQPKYERKTFVPIDPPPYWRYGQSSPDGIMPYALKRGITLEDVRTFGLLWCDQGRYAHRMVFPVWHEGVLVYWQARAMWEEFEHPGPGKYIKSLNPPRVEGAAGSGDVLFNLHQAKGYRRVCVTEGPIDAIHVGPDAVCTFGKKISHAQVGMLHRAGVKELDLMWDGPSQSEPHGAWPEMFMAAEFLRSQFVVRLVFLPRGDPGDYPREELTWLRLNRAQSVNEGRLEKLV